MGIEIWNYWFWASVNACGFEFLNLSIKGDKVLSVGGEI